MRLLCGPQGYPFDRSAGTCEVVLYGRADVPERGSAGAALREQIRKAKLYPAPRAWDFLSLALAAVAADTAGHRRSSPDGWTRQFDLIVAVADAGFWTSQRTLVEGLLAFLTTDIWSVDFVEGGALPAAPRKPFLPPEQCVSLLSGGLDSFIGNVDLAATGRRAFAVSHTVRGDGENQRKFASVIGNGLRHLQINHNVRVPLPEAPASQRSRSLIFIAYGVLAATSLASYHGGDPVTLYLCENGFISINPPLTPMRLGSLSTRTTHPVFLRRVQQLLDAAGLNVKLENPYQLATKGEMLRDCRDQTLVGAHATRTTSCGRYLQHGYEHCGRCVPCLVRRAAFLAAGTSDTTEYTFDNLGRDDSDYAGFDDVRAVAMAVEEVRLSGLETWLGISLSTALLGDVSAIESMVGRGLNELDALLTAHGVR